jgi:hypothetical protein
MGDGLHIALEGLHGAERLVVSQLKQYDGLIDEGIVLRWAHLLSVEDELAKFETYAGVVYCRWDQSCKREVRNRNSDRMELSMHS